ncbi:hypothetical protein ACFGVR_00150 [Mucilaginibacter sp. AW1-3]
MKVLFAVIISIFVYGAAIAQTTGEPVKGQNIRICAPSRSSLLPPPMYILFKNKKEIYRTSIAAPNINPRDIESIQVLKGISATAKYGSKADNGVVEIYMKKGTKLDTNKIKPDTSKIKLKTDTGKIIRYRGGN